MPRLMVSSSAPGCVASRWLACIIIPGVQKPHCTAPCATKASRSASARGSAASPSMVATWRPSQSTANIRQAFTDTPSTTIVHAPHSPSPQPYLVPVRPSTSRIIVSALMSTGTVARVLTPFRVNSMSCLSGMVEHPSRHVVDQFLAVPGAGAHVVDRVHLVAGRFGGPRDGGRVEPLSLERLLGPAGAHRRRRDRAERDAHVRQRAAVENAGDADRDRRDVERGPGAELEEARVVAG